MIKTLLQTFSLILLLFMTGCERSEDNTDTRRQATVKQVHEEVRKAVPMQAPAKILRIIPGGVEVDDKREIVLQFDRELVPLGDMARTKDEIDIKITPELQCEWRWLNRSALACRLNEGTRLKAATRYKLDIAKVLSFVDGVQLDAPMQHVFDTRRPAVDYVDLIQWSSPGRPFLDVHFNMPVTKASVLKSLALVEESEPRVNHPFELMQAREHESNGTHIIEYIKGTSRMDVAQQRWVITPAQELLSPLQHKLYDRGGLVTPTGTLKGEAQQYARYSFYPFAPFTLNGIRCYNSDHEYKTYSDDAFTEKDPGCNPLYRVGLSFNAPVLRSMVAKHTTLNPPLDGGRTDYDPWENSYDQTGLDRNHHDPHQEYVVWLPERLKADTNYTFSYDAAAFKDEFGRTLSKSRLQRFRTLHRDPALNVPLSNAVLEEGVESYVPLYATNLSRIHLDYNAITAAGAVEPIHGYRAIKTIDVTDISYKLKVGIRDILKGESGVVYGMISTPDIRGYETLLAQVTPFQVHVKLGHFNTLVWVTDLATGLPVEGAEVTLNSGYLNKLHLLSQVGDTVLSDTSGLGHLMGTDSFEPFAENLRWVSDKEKHYFIKVKKGSQMALLPLKSAYIVYDYSAYPSMSRHGDHIKAWGTTAQGVYKVGDTVAYKIYVRDQNNTALTPPPERDYTLEVRDPMDKLVYTTTGDLSSFGTMQGSFQLPKTAAVGGYSFILTHKGHIKTKESSYTWYPMTMLVSDFTPAPFSVKTELNGEHFHVGDTLKIETLATMYSGGPYTKAQTRISAYLFAKAFHSEHPLAKGFSFSDAEYGDVGLLNIKEYLDDKGEIKTELLLKATGITYGELLVESSVKDERGKYVSSSRRATYSQRDSFVGLKETRWVYDKGVPSEVELLVVDEKGVPKAGIPVDVKVQYRSFKSARVKGSGNAFVTQSSVTWVDESNCTLRSSNEPLSCAFTPMHVGSYRFIATIKDPDGSEDHTILYSWVSGSGSVAWDQGDDSRLDIIPESSDYKVGKKARFLVKNPYPGAQALITVERFGVLDSWVQTLETATPVIELDVRPEYIPGFYLSVVVTSPRVSKPLKEGNVDLGKPSFKMGYLICHVRDEDKSLSIKVTTDKEVYEPGEHVDLQVQVSDERTKAAQQYEVALVAIDASVLALNRSGSAYYDPYLGFNSLEALDVTNYSLLTRLVGRQKFEKKGANPGGDGGATVSAARLRNDFKYVAYWSPSLLTDTKGSLKTSFKVPDNLTQWKIIAIVVDRSDKMGLGETDIKSNKSTEIRAVMPNQLLEGDSFSAGFNIMNRTDVKRELSVHIETMMPGGQVQKSTKQITLEPFARENLYIPIKAETAGEITFKITAEDKAGSDGLVHTLSVHQHSVLETMSNFGSTTQQRVIEKVLIPKEIIPDAGSVSLLLSSSIVGNTKGAFSYIKDYPYWCWEQRLTKAVAAAQFKTLRSYLPKELEWKEAAGLTDRMLTEASSFQAPNGGMAFWIGSNAYVSPYLSAYTALEFAWLKRAGYKIPVDVEEKLHGYLQKMLTSDIVPSYYTTQMHATVRAVALNALAMSHKSTPQQLSRYARHSERMSLFGKANYLQALLTQKGSDEKIKKEILTTILATAVQSAGKFSFNEPQTSGSAYLLATPMRSNCAILSALVDAEQDDVLKPLIKDIAPKLVRTITQTRGQKEHWENTQENIFCMAAVVDYAKRYESTPVEIQVDVSFDDHAVGSAEFTSLRAPAQTISTPITPQIVGKETNLTIERKGSGRLYYISRIAFARNARSAERVNSGIEIRREYSIKRNGTFELLSTPMKIRQGEIVRVDLFISLPTARNFVVVDDAVPGGLEPVNSDLATTSVTDARKGTFVADKASWWFHFSDWNSYGHYGWSFYHKELRHDSAHFYADYLPAGNYHLSYTAQAIAEGTFSVMPASVEEMYDPDLYGHSLPSTLIVTKE